MPTTVLAMVDSLRSRYPDRYLVLDSPSVLGSPDARILSEVADLVVLVAYMRGVGRASGLEAEGLGAGIIRVRDGSLTEITLFQSKDEALEEAGRFQ